MWKKLIAPTLIVVLSVLYLIGFIIFILSVPVIPLFAKLAGILIPLVVAGCMIAVLISRVREIKSGNEDDLDQY